MQLNAILKGKEVLKIEKAQSLAAQAFIKTKKNNVNNNFTNKKSINSNYSLDLLKSNIKELREISQQVVSTDALKPAFAACLKLKDIKAINIILIKKKDI